MEVITALVLILLSSAGARNIPVHMDRPSELPPVFDDLPSYTKTPLATIFPTGELEDSVVYVEDLRLHLNKNADKDENVEDHIYSVVNLDTDININDQKMSKTNEEEELNSALKPVEAIEGQNNKKTEELLLEDRTAFDAGCPLRTVKVGDGCWPEDEKR